MIARLGRHPAFPPHMSTGWGAIIIGIARHHSRGGDEQVAEDRLMMKVDDRSACFRAWDCGLTGGLVVRHPGRSDMTGYIGKPQGSAGRQTDTACLWR